MAQSYTRITTHSVRTLVCRTVQSSSRLVAMIAGVLAQREQCLGEEEEEERVRRKFLIHDDIMETLYVIPTVICCLRYDGCEPIYSLHHFWKLKRVCEHNMATTSRSILIYGIRLT